MLGPTPEDPARRESDVLDAEWLAELLEHGLLRGRIVPAPDPGAAESDPVSQTMIQAHTSDPPVADPAGAGLQGGANHGGGVGPAWRHDAGQLTTATARRCRSTAALARQRARCGARSATAW